MMSNDWYTRHLRKELKVLYTADKIFEIFITLSLMCIAMTLFFQHYVLVILPSTCMKVANKQRVRYKKRIVECIDTLCCFETHPEISDNEVKERAKKILYFYE
jgi:hypothetical protein